MANSYTPPDRSTYDPGWNDPPSMPTSTAGQATTAPKPRTSLNKRVAFPMQSSAASQTTVQTTAEGLPLPFSTAKYQPPAVNSALPPQLSSSPPQLPPPPPTSCAVIESASLPTVFKPETNSTQSTLENFNSATAREQCYSIFNCFANTMATTNTDPCKLNEIRKRLESLHHMWQENKLDDSVQKILYALANALENRDASAAMVQHRNLVTQHINVATHWATALRQLILTLCPEIESTAENAPAQLSETEIVQFIDISTKPVVLDSNVPSFLQGSNQPLPVAASDSTDAPQTSSNDNTDGSLNASTDNGIEPSASKSKFGRFGRILHI